MLLSPRWLWSSRAPAARLARATLLPASVLYRAAMSLRILAYRTGLMPVRRAAVPVIAVGNLTVGGSGKTPVAAWIAAYYRRAGRTPAVVLRGYGGDEGDVHRRLAPGAIVVEDPHRPRGIEAAVRRGADVVVLDDAYQRLDVARDVNIAVISAESSRAARWTLPAGPWREGWRALGRAHVVVVTRKRADRQTALAVLDAVRLRAPGACVGLARLEIGGFRPLRSGEPVPPSRLQGARVALAAGVADPESVAAQIERLGAEVRVLALPDHHSYDARDVTRLLHVQETVDYVVVTEKDAVKLDALWPADAKEPLVASLEVTWEDGYLDVERVLNAGRSSAS